MKRKKKQTKKKKKKVLIKVLRFLGSEVQVRRDVLSGNSGRKFEDPVSQICRVPLEIG